MNTRDRKSPNYNAAAWRGSKKEDGRMPFFLQRPTLVTIAAVFFFVEIASLYSYRENKARQGDIEFSSFDVDSSNTGLARNDIVATDEFQISPELASKSGTFTSGSESDIVSTDEFQISPEFASESSSSFAGSGKYDNIITTSNESQIIPEFDSESSSSIEGLGNDTIATNESQTSPEFASEPNSTKALPSITRDNIDPPSFRPGTENRFWGNKGPIQFIYLVGVEGAGHHGVAPLLKRMCVFSGMKFHMRDKKVRFGILDHRVQRIKNRWASISNASGAHSKHVFLEDNSFPSARYHRGSPLDVIKKDTHYDLEWIVKAAREANADVKFLLLTRPFVNQVWSHKKWDGGLINHAKTLAKFMGHIHDELTRINELDMWSRIDYTWFSDENCPKIVPKLADFLEWPSPSDPKEFCSKTPFHISTKAVNLTSSEEDFFKKLQADYASRWGSYLRADKSLMNA